MAKTNAKIGRSYVPATYSLTVNNLRLASQDIAAWKQAIDAARSATNPRRKLLYDLYDSIIIDGHLEAVMNKRIINITNKRIRFVIDGDEGAEDDQVRDEILQAPWFYQLNKLAMTAKPFGHALVELIPEGGKIVKAVLINRANVVPERNFVAWHYANLDDGFNYLIDKPYCSYMIEAGEDKSYGLLMIAAQYVIYKRGGLGDWSQFAELFGMPFRVGEYDPYDDRARQLLDDGLKNMGGAGYAVIPKGSSLNFHKSDGGTGSSTIYKDLIEVCNSEISKTFLGSTLTTDQGSKGTHALGAVHADVEKSIGIADMIEHEMLLNWQVKPKLAALGYPVERGRFKFEELSTISLMDRIEIDNILQGIIPVAQDYFYETYNVPRPKNGQEPAGKKEMPISEPVGKTVPKKKTLSLNPSHEVCCQVTHVFHLSDDPYGDLSDDERSLIDAIYKKDGTKYDYKTMMANTSKLREGLGNQLLGAEYDTPDYKAATMMEMNLNRFGYDKSLATVFELNQQLRQSSTYSEFKKKAARVLVTYNNHQLQTEYDTAVAVAQNARAWNDAWENREDYPYLMYQTVGDQRVRQEHAVLDGKYFKIDDSSWHAIHPPNGWNCRCEMIPKKTAPRGKLTTGPDAIGLLGDSYDKMVKDGFNANRGITKEVFDLNKSYASKLSSAARIADTKLTWRDAGLKKFADMKNLPKLPDLNKTVDDVQADFDAKKDGKIKLYSDYLGRKIGLHQKQVIQHLKGDYVAPEKNRQGLYFNIEEVLANPDEVYFKHYGQRYSYHYIKFYDGKPMVVAVDVNGKFEGATKEGFSIQTWYTTRELLRSKGVDDLRVGVLLLKKHSY
jgi:SPP1 gp7 family putative phage head morphogenesis protein